MDHSPAFVAFAQSLLGPVSSRDAYEDLDLGSLAQLEGTEREAAEILLVEVLDDGDDDPRVPRALQQLATGSAVEAMKKALGRYPLNYTKVSLAKVLWKMERYLPAVDALGTCITGGENAVVRGQAAGALAEIPGERPDLALMEVMRSDPDPTTRQVAESALYSRHGIEAYEYRPTPELVDAVKRMASADPAERKAALEDFRSAARQLRSG